MGRSRKELFRKKKKEKQIKVLKKINKQQGSGILCPVCKSTTHVQKTKPMPDLSIQKRYRVCDLCKHTFITEERVL